MRHKILTQGRYATVVSTLALFLALGGTAYAINTVDSLDIVNGSVASIDLQDNGVFATDIHDGTVTSTDVLDNALTSTDVQNESITGTDLDDNTVTGDDLRTGSVRRDDLAPLVALRPIWITVNAAGQRLDGDNIASSERLGIGRYRMDVGDPNVENCGIVATAVNRTIGADPVAGAIASAGLVDDEGTVAVTTTVGGVLQDVAFSVGVFC